MQQVHLLDHIPCCFALHFGVAGFQINVNKPFGEKDLHITIAGDITFVVIFFMNLVKYRKNICLINPAIFWKRHLDFSI